MTIRVFVHIPKTAGTYLNSALAASGFKILSHCESVIDQKDFRDLIHQYEWISGHVTLDKFQNKLSSLDIETSYYTVFRNPIKQLISQLCWQIEICADKRNHHKFLWDHSTLSISKIMQVLFANLSSQTQLFSVLESHTDYFTNNQSITILTDVQLHYLQMLEPDLLAYAQLFRDKCHQIFSSFKYIGTDLDIQSVESHFGISREALNTPELNMNESRLYLDPMILSGSDVLLKLIRYQLLDCILYATYQEKLTGRTNLLSFASLDLLLESLLDFLGKDIDYTSKSFNQSWVADIRSSVISSMQTLHKEYHDSLNLG
jgi:hypothetical protein